MTTGKKTKRKPPPASYLRLIQGFPLRPIRSEAELDRAIALINRLLDRDDLDAAEADYLDVLGDLVEKYEEVHYPMGDVSDGKMLAFLIEQKGVKQADVARATGMMTSTICEVLKDRRQLTRAQIAKLAAYFHVEPGVFNFSPEVRPASSGF
jgi:HTH-type transcriptional regulator/antitoxin HigA